MSIGGVLSAAAVAVRLAAEEMVTAAADEETGPAMVRVPTNKRKAWRNDPRCDPMARFYPKANVDHLLYAEEV